MDSYIVTVQDVLMLQNRERYMDAVEAVVNGVFGHGGLAVMHIDIQ